MSLEIGRRYRINSPSHQHDGRVGTLESLAADSAWLMVNGRLARVAANDITDCNVVQEDMTHLRVRPALLIEWEDEETFA